MFLLSHGTFPTIVCDTMQKQLSHHLVAVARLFAQARGYELSTLGRLAALDSRFFSLLIEQPDANFTVRKYDEVMTWFADNWPADVAWPADVPRPKTDKKKKAAG